MKSLEERIVAIKNRNMKVEQDKSWETSLTRRCAIAVITYLTACIYLYIISDQNVLLHSLVPTGGYILSTLSVSFIKKLWIRFLVQS